MIGIRNIFKVLADVVFTANTTLATVGLKSPIAANETQKIRAWVPFTVGATGGIKCELVTPGGASSPAVTVIFYNTVAPSVDITLDGINNPINDALADEGGHWALIEAIVTNGATPGNLDLQFAQNSAANATTILAGSTMEVVKM